MIISTCCLQCCNIATSQSRPSNPLLNPLPLALPTFAFASMCGSQYFGTRKGLPFQSSWLARSEAVPSAATYRRKVALLCITRTCALTKLTKPASLSAICQLDKTRFFRNLFAYLSITLLSVHCISFSIKGMTLKL